MALDLGEKRYVKQTGLEARVASLIEPVAIDLGYALVRVRITQENGCTLQIMAEDAQGRFTIQDCERLSKEISALLDVEDPIARAYHLEVSSPGIDRPLVRARDYAAHIGHEAKIELSDPIDGRKRYRGLIAAVTGDSLTVTLPDVPSGTAPDQVLPLAAIAEAKLVMTDRLIALAEADQADYPIDAAADIETIDADTDDEPDELARGDQ